MASLISAVSGVKHVIYTMFGSQDAIDTTEETTELLTSKQETRASDDRRGTIQSLGVPSWLLAERDIMEHPAYHSVLKGSKAEALLRQQGHNCYLIRLDGKNKLRLSVLHKSEKDPVPLFRNFKICIDKKSGITMYEIVGTEIKFDNISNLLEYYRDQPVSDEIDGIGSPVIAHVDSDADSSESDGTDYYHTVQTEGPIEHSFSDAELIRKRSTLKNLRRGSRDDIDVNYSIGKDSGKFTAISHQPHRRSESVKVYKTQRSPKNLARTKAPLKALNIEQHQSFIGTMTSTQAKKALMEHGKINCYLTRYSKSRKEYTLSVKHRGKVYHFGINSAQSVFEIKGGGKRFRNGFDMLEYYQQYPVNINVGNIGEPITSVPECKNEELSASSVFSSSFEEKEDEQTVISPSLTLLTLIKWIDGHGKKKRLRILEKVAIKWKTVGLLLQQDMPMLENYRSIGKDDVECCRHVFFQWLENGCHSEYQPTWEGVYTLLHDVEHGSVAEELKEALASKGVIINTE